MNLTYRTPPAAPNDGKRIITLASANPGNFLRNIQPAIAIILAAMMLQVPLASSGSQVLIPTTADARIGNLFGADGTSTYLSVYINTSSGNLQRTVIQFNLSALGTNAVITNATLKLFADANLGPSGNPSGKPMEIYRVTQPWAETAVSWTSRTSGAQWTTFGGDYVGTTGVQNTQPYAVNSTVVTNGYYNSSPRELDWDVTSLVQEWYAGTHPNYGLMLLSYSVNGLYFRSRENVTNIPVLQVNLADAPPPPPVITAKATNGAVILNWSAIVGRSYQAQSSTNLVQTNWSNLPGPITATNSTAAQSDPFGTFTQKFYRVILLP